MSVWKVSYYRCFWSESHFKSWSEKRKKKQKTTIVGLMLKVVGTLVWTLHMFKQGWKRGGSEGGSKTWLGSVCRKPARGIKVAFKRSGASRGRMGPDLFLFLPHFTGSHCGFYKHQPVLPLCSPTLESSWRRTPPSGLTSAHSRSSPLDISPSSRSKGSLWHRLWHGDNFLWGHWLSSPMTPGLEETLNKKKTAVCLMTFLFGESHVSFTVFLHHLRDCLQK